MTYWRNNSHKPPTTLQLLSVFHPFGSFVSVLIVFLFIEFSIVINERALVNYISMELFNFTKLSFVDREKNLNNLLDISV